MGAQLEWEGEAVDIDREADPAVAFRKALGQFATGVTIVTTAVEAEVHGMTANAFMSVSLDPPLVVVAVDKKTRMHGFLEESGRYGVSVLGDHQAELSDHFAGRARREVPVEFTWIRQTPVVEGAIAHLVARVVRQYWGGDHSLFLGEVEYFRWGTGRPLLFLNGRYERLIKGVL